MDSQESESKGRGRPRQGKETDFGRRILARMHQMNIPSLPALLERLKIVDPQTTWYHQQLHVALIKQGYEPGGVRLIGLARALKCSPRWLITGEGPETCACCRK